MAFAEVTARYEQSGFVHLPAFLDQHELVQLRQITARFHQQWLIENQNFYRQRAINSAYLTHVDRMPAEDRHNTFRLNHSKKITGTGIPSTFIPRQKSRHCWALPAFFITG